MTPCQNPVTMCENQLSSYQDLMIPSQNQLELENLLQNQLLTPNIDLMSNPTPCQNEMSLTNDQCNVCQNNPLLITRNAIYPSYANRVLANPTINTILDPNTKLYNNHGVEVLRSPCDVPNVVNNYIIVPPEILMKDCKKDRNDQTNRERREKDKKKNSKIRNKKNRKPINVNHRNEVSKNELPLLNENNTKINKTQNDVTNRPTNHEARNEIIDAHDVILDTNNNKIILNQKTKIPSNEIKITEINVPQTEGIDESKQLKNDPTQIANFNTQVPVRNLYNSPYTQIPMSNFYNSPCLSNNYQYVTTGIDNKANYNNLLDQYVQFYNDDQKTNVNEVETFGSKYQDNAKIIDKNVNSTDKNKYIVTKGNNVPKRRNSQNKSATIKLNGNLIPQDKEEFVIQDLRRKFPNIPENLVKDLIRHMKKHLQPGQNIIRNQYPMFPMNFEQFYKTPFYNTPRNYRNGRRNSYIRNNRRRKGKPKNTNDSNRETTTDIPTKINGTNTNNTSTSTEIVKYQEVSNLIEENKTKELGNGTTVNECEPAEKVGNISVTEKTNTSLMANESDSPLDVKETVSVIEENSDSKFSVKLEETEIKVQPEAVLPENTQVITTPELGKEDIVHPMPMNSVDDYYPDFTVDNHAYFLSSNEDVHLENLEDRYHYTTDRNLQFAEGNRERRTFKGNNNKNKFIKNSIAERNLFEYITTERGKHKAIYSETERTTEATVQFRTPPSLEKPDFETKKVDSRQTSVEDTIYTPVYTNKDVTYKVSTYSSTKKPLYNLTEKPSKNVSDKLPETRKIETVFANSKVVKYGSNHDDDTSNLEGVTDTNIPINSKKERDDNRDIKMPSDSDKTVVYATSIPYVY